jgi:hypothetical protein
VVRRAGGRDRVRPEPVDAGRSLTTPGLGPETRPVESDWSLTLVVGPELSEHRQDQPPAALACELKGRCLRAWMGRAPVLGVHGGPRYGSRLGADPLRLVGGVGVRRRDDREVGGLSGYRVGGAARVFGSAWRGGSSPARGDALHLHDGCSVPSRSRSTPWPSTATTWRCIHGPSKILRPALWAPVNASWLAGFHPTAQNGHTLPCVSRLPLRNSAARAHW